MLPSKGFTLVETIIAIGLLAGAVVVCAHVVASSVRTNASTRYRTIAAIAAQQRLDRLRAEATLADTTGEAAHIDASGLDVCAPALPPCAAAALTTRWSVAPLPAFPDMVVIEVVVSHAHRASGVVRAFAVRPRTVR